eukprot:scaffold179_cov368-Prasinococcus_capsulatus_cf.AAC.42
MSSRSPERSVSDGTGDNERNATSRVEPVASPERSFRTASLLPRSAHKNTLLGRRPPGSSCCPPLHSSLKGAAGALLTGDLASARQRKLPLQFHPPALFAHAIHSGSHRQHDHHNSGRPGDHQTISSLGGHPRGLRRAPSVGAPPHG